MLKVQTKKLGTVVVVSLQGQIVNGETEIFRNAVAALSEASAVKLDFAGVSTVDAGGLGLMLALRQQAESRGIRLELMNVNKRVDMLIKLTRLDSVFQITSPVEYFPAAARSQRAGLPVQGTPLASCA